MEADWAAEVGGDAAAIDADWAGFVDLRAKPEAVGEIAETRDFAALREALLMLNGAASAVFTAKCDVWRLAAEELDPFEYDFGPAEEMEGLACWVDVVARDAAMFGSFEMQRDWARRAVEFLKREPVRSGRVDLVIRAARAGGVDGFGVTLYAAGCGVDADAARMALEMVLRAAVNVTMREARPPGAGDVGE